MVTIWTIIERVYIIKSNYQSSLLNPRQFYKTSMELFEPKCRCLAHKTSQQWGAMKSDSIYRTRKCKITNFLTFLIPPTNLITFPPGRKSAARIPLPLWPSRISSVLFVLRFHRLIIPLADLEMKLQIFLILSDFTVKPWTRIYKELSINNYYSRRVAGRGRGGKRPVEFSITWQQILTLENTHPHQESSLVFSIFLFFGLWYFAKRNETKRYFAKWYFAKRYFAIWYFAKQLQHNASSHLI